MRILVTNDDGVDGEGLHVLARALRPHGEVTIVAPDSEYSGAGASLGPLHLIRPVVHEVQIEGIDVAYSVSGPPALCVFFARLGAFGVAPDLVVAGINPGSNVGRSVYHSGTVGAALTARNGGISGVAVSQAVDNWGVEGQADEDDVADQRWDTAAAVAEVVVGGLTADPPTPPQVVNINVPNVAIADLKGWRRTEVGAAPPRAMAEARLERRPGHTGGYRVRTEWGDAEPLPPETDGGAVMAGWASVTWLSRIVGDETISDRAVAGLDQLLAGPANART